jgi:GNAT superfamily N-acetyltransferase
MFSFWSSVSFGGIAARSVEGKPVTIRPARANDGTAMADVRREAILARAGSPYSQSVLDAWAAEATPDGSMRYVDEIADPGIIVVVVECVDQIIGFAIADPARAELTSIYVKPNSIGHVGRALLSHVEKRAFATAETLSCVAALSAVPFYQANGYTERGGVDYADGSGTGAPCMKMQKSRADHSS